MRHSLAPPLFRTLSLASPPAFVDSALVPGVPNEIRLALGREPEAHVCSLIVRSGRRFGSFQLKATLHCSKSRVFNCFIRKGGLFPPPLRVAEDSRVHNLGGVMQRSQGGCVSASLQSMLAGALVLWAVLGCATMVSAQVNTATLSGTVSDPQGLAVKGARVTMTNASTGAQRTAVTDDGGRYNLVGLPPGRYKMIVDGGTNFAVYENTSVVLTVGEAATFDAHLDLRGMQQTVTVTTEAAPIETSKTDVSQTVEQRRIDNLPINRSEERRVGKECRTQ